MKSIFFIIAGLIFNAVLSVSYRIYNYSKFHDADKLADLIGQSVMGVVLFILAYFVFKNRKWAVVASLIYGIVFLLVTPLYTWKILLPSSPGFFDHFENIAYTLGLILIVAASYATL
jgi:hypothetical protein